MTRLDFVHVTVLLQEAVAALNPRDGGRYVDGTLGRAGHTRRLLEQCSPTGKVLAIDKDIAAIEYARRSLLDAGQRLLLVHGNFREILKICERCEFTPVDGILLDLGVSSPQFDDAQRGFSYQLDAPLDMRMDLRQSTTAADVVNSMEQTELSTVLWELGEERFHARIAAAIHRARQHRPIRTTGELAEIVKSAIPAATRRTGPHPARRTFQALRMTVNDELSALDAGLRSGFDALAPAGRLAVITFHSLEDRIVKRAFQGFAAGCVCPPDFPVCVCGRVAQGRMVTRKPTLPGEQETASNRRARSAKLRVVEKIA